VSVLCLVPTPLRARRAARRLCDAQGGILLGARLTSVEAVATGLLAAAGDRRPVLTPLASALLSREAAAAAGPPFDAGDPGGGLARALERALAELREGEVVPDELRAAAAEVGGRTGVRLRSLADALTAAEARRATLDALDATAALRAAVEAFRRGPLPDDMRGVDLLVVEGYRALPPAALDLVAALAARVPRTQLRIPFFPERADACEPAERLLRAVEALHETAARREVSVLLEDVDARAPRLARVLRTVAAGPGGGPAGEAGLLAAAPGAGEDGEAEAAAAEVLRLLEAGFAPEDVAVIASDAGAAAPRLARAFAALGVPFAPGRGESLRELRPVRDVLAAYEAALRPERPALEALAESGYLGLGLPARLTVLLDRAGALPGRVAPEEALRARATALTASRAAGERAALQRAAEALGAARAALAPLAAAGAPREHAARLRGFLLAAGARRRAARGDPGVARRDLAALERLEDAADDLARALALLGRAEERLEARAWSALLRVALDRAAVADPDPAAGAVELWPLSEAPGLSARAAVLVGSGRGAFPAAAPPEPLLRDDDRAALNRAAGRAAVATGPTLRARALHAAFCALAAGREALVVAWAGPGPEGEGPGLAPLAAEALAAGGADLRGAGADAAGASLAAWLRASARAARGAPPDGATAGALLGAPAEVAARAADAWARGAVEAERSRAVLERRAAPAAGLVTAPLVEELRRTLPAEWSPSQLETHARCPWRFFADVALGLAEPEGGDLDIDPRDEGQLVHGVLERFFRARLARGAGPLRGEPGELEELRAAATALFAGFEAEGRVGDPAVWVARREVVLATLERLVRAEAARPDGLAPALLEHRFGGGAPAPPLVFADGGEEVRLRGRLDRVDADGERLLLLDYKNARSGAGWREKLDPEALGDVNFQVPAYLMAAARALPGRRRLEASYLLVRSAERVAPFATDAGDPMLAEGAEARAAARAAGARPFGDAVLAAVRRIRAGELPLAPRDCAGCPHGAACRAEGSAEAAP
jgi:hypothetical protein